MNDPIFNEDFFYPKMRFLIFSTKFYGKVYLSKKESWQSFPTYMCVCMELHIFRVRIYQNMKSLCSILMSSNNRFFKSVRWGTGCMDGWTDYHQEPNTRFTEMYKVPDVVHSGCYSMQQSPSSEATRYKINQEIPRIVWKVKVHYLSHMCHHLSLS